LEYWFENIFSDEIKKRIRIFNSDEQDAFKFDDYVIRFDENIEVL
jgi:hypothetical protein